MIGIGQNVENVTEHGQQVLLEESIGNSCILFREVADELDGNCIEWLSGQETTLRYLINAHGSGRSRRYLAWYA